MLDRDAILSMQFKSTVVDTPRGEVRVRVISAAARESLESLARPDNKGYIRAMWVALAACKEDGSRMFADGDIETLSTLDCTFIVPIFDAAWELNGASKDSIEKAEKN